MYFKAISLKNKKPNSGVFRNKVVLIKGKTKEITAFTLGAAPDWEWFMEKGYTHWIKHISKKEILAELEDSLEG